MRSIGLLSAKGGVGKTTLCLNLAAVLARRGKRVSVVDLDPQRSATAWAQIGALPFEVRAWQGGASAWRRRREFAALLSELRGLVLLDCPPALAEPALLAAVWADLVLVPSGVSVLDLWGVRATLETVAEARGVRSGTGPAVLLVPYRIMPRTLVGRALPEVLGGLGEPVGPAIASRLAVATSAALGEVVAEGTPAAAEFEALADCVDSRLREIEKSENGE